MQRTKGNEKINANEQGTCPGTREGSLVPSTAAHSPIAVHSPRAAPNGLIQWKLLHSLDQGSCGGPWTRSPSTQMRLHPQMVGE